MDLTADAAALFKATEQDEQGGARWSSNTRPSEMIPTTMARNRGFNRLKDVSEAYVQPTQSTSDYCFVA